MFMCCAPGDEAHFGVAEMEDIAVGERQAAARRERAAIDLRAVFAAEVFKQIGGGIGRDDTGMFGGDRRVGQDDVAGDGAADQRFGGQNVQFPVGADQAGRGAAETEGGC